MRIKYQEIEVNMERMQSKTRKIVPAWETPIVQSVHPSTEVIRDVCLEVEAPSVGGEYQRLGTAYGADREEGGTVGDPHIEGVYGKGPMGVAELRRAMEASRLPKNTPITVFEPPPTMRKDLLQAIASDIAVGDVLGDIGEDKLSEDEETLAA